MTPERRAEFERLVEEYAQERISQVTCPGGLKCANVHNATVEDARALLAKHKEATDG